MVYIDLSIDKEAFEKFKDLLAKNSLKDKDDKSYLYDGNLGEDMKLDLHDVDFNSEQLMLSTEFSIGKERLGNVAVYATLEDIGWTTLLALKAAIDAKLGKVAETIENLL